jgi:hypothetical protein
LEQLKQIEVNLNEENKQLQDKLKALKIDISRKENMIKELKDKVS